LNVGLSFSTNRFQNMMNESRMELWSSPQIKGKVSVPRRYYFLVATFIFNVIAMKPTKEISLTELLDEAQMFFSGTLGSSAAWYVLQVKQDLQIRRLLKNTVGDRRIQLIKINRKRFKETWPDIKLNFNPDSEEMQVFSE
jgi:hypothetical protein